MSVEIFYRTFTLKMPECAKAPFCLHADASDCRFRLFL